MGNFKLICKLLRIGDLGLWFKLNWRPNFDKKYVLDRKIEFEWKFN